MNKSILLIIGLLLVVVGLVKPNLNLSDINKPKPSTVIITPPHDQNIKDLCKPLINSLKNGPSDRSKDGQRLSDLYADLSTLISLDGENEVIKTTEEIKQANGLSGIMLRMDIKGKYPGLTEAAQSIIIASLGDDLVPLDKELRIKAVDAFMALAWACNEGSK